MHGAVCKSATARFLHLEAPDSVQSFGHTFCVAPVVLHARQSPTAPDGPYRTRLAIHRAGCGMRWHCIRLPSQSHAGYMQDWLQRKRGKPASSANETSCDTMD